MQDYKISLEHLRTDLETLHPQWHMNLLELQICNRIPEPLYQSKKTTQIRKPLPLKIKYFSHFSFIIYEISLLTFTASHRNRIGEGKMQVKIWTHVKCTVALKVYIGTSLTRKPISRFLCVLAGVGVFLHWNKSSNRQWLTTWTLLVSDCFWSPSWILGPQNSQLDTWNVLRLRSSLGMSWLWLCTSCWTNEDSE